MDDKVLSVLLSVSKRRLLFSRAHVYTVASPPHTNAPSARCIICLDVSSHTLPDHTFTQRIYKWGSFTSFPHSFSRLRSLKKKKKKEKNARPWFHKPKVSKIDLSVLNYSPRLYWPLRFSKGGRVCLALRAFTESLILVENLTDSRIRSYSIYKRCIKFRNVKKKNWIANVVDGHMMIYERSLIWFNPAVEHIGIRGSSLPRCNVPRLTMRAW